MGSYDQLTDDELIQKFREGNLQIVDFLMEKYKNMVRKKAREMYLQGAENDDLIQEGMIGLFKAIQDYKIEESASLHTFADLCVSRQIYSAIEASKRKKHIPLNSYISIYPEDGEVEHPDLQEAIQDEQGNPEALFIGKEFQESLEYKLSRELSALEQKVLYLHMKGEGYRTIATLLDKSPKVIDNALQRIKQKTAVIIKNQ